MKSGFRSIMVILSLGDGPVGTLRGARAVGQKERVGTDE
jgi:hypothetical protein